MDELKKELNNWFIAFYEKHETCQELGDYHVDSLEKPESDDDFFAKELMEFLENKGYEITKKELK